MKYRLGDAVKFSDPQVSELVGRVNKIDPLSYRPYLISVVPNMACLLSGLYWRQEEDLTSVPEEEVPQPLPADHWLLKALDEMAASA